MTSNLEENEISTQVHSDIAIRFILLYQITVVFKYPIHVTTMA
jgi:hypothetical protein